MFYRKRLLILALVSFLTAVCVNAQMPQRDDRQRTASISGRVTVSGKPAANARVAIIELKPENQGEVMINPGENVRAVYSAVTDGDGRYRVLTLPEGKYEIRVMLGSHVRDKGSPAQPLVETLRLREGESRDDVNFALVRGGVITGRVTDSNGRPLIAWRIRCQTLNEQGMRTEYSERSGTGMFQTDDRGIYRLYGLGAGRYLVSAVSENEHGLSQGSSSRYPRTWHPDASNENQANIIEVKEGGEVTGVDIRIGTATKTYEVTGRVIDDETNNPVAGTGLHCVKPGEGGFGGTSRTDAQGFFRFAGLAPGQYQIGLADLQSILTGRGSDYYADGVKVEVQGGDVAGVEIRMKRGATISGLAVIEDGDQAVRSSLSQTLVNAVSRSTQLSEVGGGMGFGSAVSRIGEDGSFLIRGIRPGKVVFSILNFNDRTIRLLRVERDGVNVTDGLDLPGRENIAGVRLFFGKGTCVIRGRVLVTGGSLPAGALMSVFARGDKTANNFAGQAEVDSKGQFTIEGLLPGEYTVTLVVQNQNPQNRMSSPGTEPQKIQVTRGVEAQVTLTLDLRRKNEE
jgi:protocatechuate 3,4-dioxygenase beta subunit